MSYSNITDQAQHMAAAKNVSRQTLAFTLMQLTRSLGHYTCSILAPML
jgi:hypothetical protein